jgi:hypothetical protein
MYQGAVQLVANASHGLSWVIFSGDGTNYDPLKSSSENYSLPTADERALIDKLRGLIKHTSMFNYFNLA